MFIYKALPDRFEQLVTAAKLEGKAEQSKKTSGRKKFDGTNADDANKANLNVLNKQIGTGDSIDLGAGSDLFHFNKRGIKEGTYNVDMGDDVVRPGRLGRDNDMLKLAKDLSAYTISQDIVNGKNVLRVEDKDTGVIINFTDVEAVLTQNGRYGLVNQNGVWDQGKVESLIADAGGDEIDWTHKNVVDSAYLADHVSVNLGAGQDIFRMNDDVTGEKTVDLGDADGARDKIELRASINDYNIVVDLANSKATFTRDVNGDSQSITFESIGAEDVFVFKNKVDGTNYVDDTFAWTDLVVLPSVVTISATLAAIPELAPIYGLEPLDDADKDDMKIVADLDIELGTIA